MALARRRTEASPRAYSYGSTAAIVTSMGLVAGFDATSRSRTPIVTGLLIVALADNLSDSLSIHMYQESEHADQKAAFRATISNFVARLLVALSFVAMVVLVPPRWSVRMSLIWGLLLLGGLTFAVARARNVKPWPEIGKHVAVAAFVVALSRALAAGIVAWGSS